MKFSSELLKGATKNIILAAIQEKERYGYDIVKAVREKSAELVRLGEGSLYPALHELEKNKLISSYWEEVGGRKRKYYKITPKGNKALKEARKEWRLFSETIHSLYFPAV